MKRVSRMKLALVVLLILGACVSLIQGLNNAILRDEGSQDNQWGPSRALLERTDPYEAHLDPIAPSPFILCQAPNYPASGLLFLWPYAVWEWPTAKALWAISNVVFTAVIVLCLFLLLPQDTPRVSKLLLPTLFLMGTPWRNGVGNGQHALFTLAFFLLAVVMLTRSRKYSGIPLTVSWFKYTIAFPLSLFFARSKRGWQAICIAAAVHAGLTVFLAIWVNTSPIDLLLGPLKVAQSATGRGEIDVFAIASVLQLDSRVLPGLVALAILGITYAVVIHDRDALSCLSTLSIASLSVCFHGVYDFVVLVLPLTYALRERARGARACGYLVLVGTIWFAGKGGDVLAHVSWITVPDPLVSACFWLKVLLFYGVLAVDWTTGLGRRRVCEATHLSRMTGHAVDQGGPQHQKQDR